MDLELKNKIAMVTGAGQGMGEAFALTFTREGADVVINDIRQETLERTASQIRALGGKVMAIQADISQEDQVNRMVEKVIQEWGGVDILVHNAGVGNTRLTEDLTAQEWHHVMGVNLDACFYTCKAVIPSMRSRGGGKIVLISSQAARRMTRQNCIAYTSSKSAILGFVRHLAFEVGPYKINVNTVLPGPTLTPNMQATDEEKQAMKNSLPLKDVCYPQDIADAVLFLASSKAKKITGSALDVDAGESLVNVPWEVFYKRRKEALAKGEPAH
jgi:NAD(P)-dependent dehydrogenase (short-subunit alcohol dehydrogenase family)